MNQAIFLTKKTVSTVLSRIKVRERANHLMSGKPRIVWFYDMNATRNPAGVTRHAMAMREELARAALSGQVDLTLCSGRISDPDILARTITVYMDTAAFREALEIPGSGEVQAFVVRPDGGILARAAGEAEAGKNPCHCDARWHRPQGRNQRNFEAEPESGEFRRCKKVQHEAGAPNQNETGGSRRSS